MQHCTPEQLALAALREPLPDADTAHLAACELCRAEVASLQRAVDALAVPQLAAPGARSPRPPAVWDGHRRRDRRDRRPAARGGRRLGGPLIAGGRPRRHVAPPVAEPPADAGRRRPCWRSGPGDVPCSWSRPPRWPVR